jgi:hypothetical protein
MDPQVKSFLLPAALIVLVVLLGVWALRELGLTFS